MHFGFYVENVCWGRVLQLTSLAGRKGFWYHIDCLLCWSSRKTVVDYIKNELTFDISTGVNSSGFGEGGVLHTLLFPSKHCTLTSQGTVKLCKRRAGWKLEFAWKVRYGFVTSLIVFRVWVHRVHVYILEPEWHAVSVAFIKMAKIKWLLLDSVWTEFWKPIAQLATKHKCNYLSSKI